MVVVVVLVFGIVYLWWWTGGGGVSRAKPKAEYGWELCQCGAECETEHVRMCAEAEALCKAEDKQPCAIAELQCAEPMMQRCRRAVHSAVRHNRAKRYWAPQGLSATLA